MEPKINPDSDLDYTFFHADGNTICVATAEDGVSFGAVVPTSEFACTDQYKLIAMIHDERNRLTLKEND